MPFQSTANGDYDWLLLAICGALVECVCVCFACLQVAIKMISSSKFGFNKRAQEAILVEVEAMRVRLFVSATSVKWNMYYGGKSMSKRLLDVLKEDICSLSTIDRKSCRASLLRRSLSELFVIAPYFRQKI